MPRVLVVVQYLLIGSSGRIQSMPKQKTPFGNQLQHRETNAVACAGLSSPNPGVITIANAVFRSKSHINPYVLANAFQLDKNVVNFSHGLLK
ncbi:hypothetical protein V6N13_014975 [Hibiscus sabdariffa]